VPTSEVLPMTFSRHGQGNFGPIVSVAMPNIGNEWGYVSGFDLTLKRRYRYRGRAMSVISASCPAPKDVHVAPFKAARGTFETGRRQNPDPDRQQHLQGRPLIG